MEHPVKFQYGSLDGYNAIENKDNDTLYFLDNSQVYKGTKLITDVHTVQRFIDTDEPLDKTMRRNYYISLETGEIRYVNDNLEYVYISRIMIQNIVLDPTFMQRFINSIKAIEMHMPTLTVASNSLIWTSSDTNNINVLTNELN